MVYNHGGKSDYFEGKGGHVITAPIRPFNEAPLFESLMLEVESLVLEVESLVLEVVIYIGGFGIKTLAIFRLSACLSAILRIAEAISAYFLLS
jgi:hypothetical protein